MAASAPVLCAGGAGVLLGAFQVWGCQWLRGGAVGYAGGGAQRLGPTIAHRNSTHVPDESKVARNLGTLIFLRYRENRRIPTM